MRKGNKFLAFALAFCLLFASSATAFAADAVTRTEAGASAESGNAALASEAARASDTTWIPVTHNYALQLLLFLWRS